MSGNASPVTVWESLQSQGVVVAGAVPFIDPNTLQPTVDDDGIHYDSTNQELGIKKLGVEQSIAGASGNIVLNTGAGQVQFAAAAQTLTLTSDRIDADSIIITTVATDDATAFSAKAIVTGQGIATIKLNAAATGITKVNFLILRKK